MENGEEGKVRNSKNLVVNRWGEELIRWREKGWNIMNDKEGDREGEVTFPGERGEIVIDCDRRIVEWKEIGRLEVEDEVESDH